MTTALQKESERYNGISGCRVITPPLPCTCGRYVSLLSSFCCYMCQDSRFLDLCALTTALSITTSFRFCWCHIHWKSLNFVWAMLYPAVCHYWVLLCPSHVWSRDVPLLELVIICSGYELGKYHAFYILSLPHLVNIIVETMYWWGWRGDRQSKLAKLKTNKSSFVNYVMRHTATFGRK